MRLSRKGRLAGGLFLLCLLLAARAEALESYQDISSRSVSPAFAILPLINGKPLTRHAGTFAFTRNHGEVGVWQGHWQLAYVQQYDYVFRFSEATARLYQQSKNDQMLDSSGTQHLYLDAWHLRSQGLKFGYRFDLPQGYLFQPSLTLLKGMAFQDGTIDGMAGVNGNQASGSATLDYHYDEDKLLGDPAWPGDGLGYTLALKLGWQGDSRHWWLTLDNLAARMDWQDAPSTTGVFDSQQQQGGTLAASALFSGQRHQGKFHQRLPFAASGRYRQDAGDWQLAFDSDYFLTRLWIAPGLRYTGWRWQPYLGYEVRSREWRLGLDHGAGFSLLIGSDRWQFHQARALTLQLSLRQSW